eukprot:2243401-Rhodomonas_salina.4
MDPSPGVHLLASYQNLMDKAPVPTNINTLDKRQHMHTAYARPEAALQQPLVAPLQVGLREQTWLREEVCASPATVVVECMMDYGQAESETYTLGTEGAKVHIWKGGVSGRSSNTVLQQMEQAKALQWLYWDQLPWQDLSERAIAQFKLKAATEAEELGFQMWVWDILDRVWTRGQFTALVGQTSLQACPTFAKWCQWPGGGLNTEAAHTKAWAVVSTSTLLQEGAEQWLLHNKRYLLIILPPIPATSQLNPQSSTPDLRDLPPQPSLFYPRSSRLVSDQPHPQQPLTGTRSRRGSWRAGQARVSRIPPASSYTTGSGSARPPRQSSLTKGSAAPSA